MLSCANKLEVMSTDGTNQKKIFNNSATLAAFPMGEGSSNALLYTSAGGTYFHIVEVEATPSGISKKTIAIVKPEEKTSPVVAMYVDSDEGYGFFMHLNGVFHYFTYDPNADINSAVKKQKTHKTFKNRGKQIISWHYNFEYGKFVFIDDDHEVNVLYVRDDMSFRSD